MNTWQEKSAKGWGVKRLDWRWHQSRHLWQNYEGKNALHKGGGWTPSNKVDIEWAGLTSEKKTLMPPVPVRFHGLNQDDLYGSTVRCWETPTSRLLLLPMLSWESDAQHNNSMKFCRTVYWCEKNKREVCFVLISAAKGFTRIAMMKKWQTNWDLWWKL